MNQKAKSNNQIIQDINGRTEGKPGPDLREIEGERDFELRNKNHNDIQIVLYLKLFLVINNQISLC